MKQLRSKVYYHIPKHYIKLQLLNFWYTCKNDECNTLIKFNKIDNNRCIIKLFK